MDKLKDEIINALKVQSEIFGDMLFDEKENLIVKRKTQVVMESYHSAKSLEELNSLICNCIKCQLGETRKNFVFGTGNPNADVLVLGEGPGADEDEQGIPFVGRAGKLLNDILKAIKFEREKVYIANIVKCRPPGNRTPSPVEMETCIPRFPLQLRV